jgi:cell division inhibitor SepF
MDREDYFYDEELDEEEGHRPSFFQRLRERLSFRRREDDLLDEPQPLVGAPDTDRRELYERIESRRMGCVCVHMRADSVAEAERAVQNLKEGRQVILNVEAVNPSIARRIVDIVHGASFALGGYRRQIGEGVYLYTPTNVYIVVEGIEELSRPSNPPRRTSRYESSDTHQRELWDDEEQGRR